MSFEAFKKFLDKHEVPYKALTGVDAVDHLCLNPDNVLKGIRFNVDIPIFAIWPQSDYCDLAQLAMTSVNDVDIQSDDNEITGLPRAKHDKIILAQHVVGMSEVIIGTQEDQWAISCAGDTFRNCLGANCDVINFSTSTNNLFQADGSQGGKFTAMRIKSRIEETFDLPAMPEVAKELMRLRVDPRAEASDLAAIVDKDPSLAAQVISWASSPYYGYQGKVNTTEIAIARVLGFEMVMNLSLGLSLGKAIDAPADGPLGLRNYWEHSICCATLAVKIARLIDTKFRPDTGMVYLCGLLHNFGHLAFALLFKPQFGVLNKHILVNEHVPVHHIEKQILGVTHCDVGTWLFENWHMPDELLVTTGWHHKPEMWNEHGIYSNLIHLTNAMLKSYGIGDAPNVNVDPIVLERLGLKIEDVVNTTESVLENIDELLTVSRQMAA
jgi:HD-like signal output (HDOD) protein